MTTTSLPMPSELGLPAAELRTLRRDLKRSQKRQGVSAFLLVAPLLLVVLLFFAAPIVSLLTVAVHSPEYAKAYPRSAAQLAHAQAIDEGFYAALFEDLLQAHQTQSGGPAARRLNQDTAGFTTMISRATRAAVQQRPAEGGYQEWFAQQDARWVQPRYQAAIQRAAPAHTDFFLLRAMDLARADDGAITPIAPEQRIFVPVLSRTLTISLSVTLVCCLLGFPLAWGIANASPFWRNVLLLGVMFPFWTSLLVRTAAWIIVLQREGPVNKMLQWLGLVQEPLTMVFNRFGVIVALTHVLLPFMVLPLYSVMASISPNYMRAAKGLGARPLWAFAQVYFPQTLPGLSAGAILVFIMAMGYYITPALLGGPGDQMISYFIAFYTNNTINWGLASALALMLLTVTLVLYTLHQYLVGHGQPQRH